MKGPDENIMWSPRMLALIRALMARTRLVAGVSIGWTLVSAALSIQRHDWMWFARSGSILTVAAVALTARAVIRLGRKAYDPKPAFRIARVIGTDYRGKDGKMYANVERSSEDIEREREENADTSAALLGFGMAIWGTLIWGYGDLVPDLFRLIKSSM